MFISIPLVIPVYAQHLVILGLSRPTVDLAGWSLGLVQQVLLFVCSFVVRV